jgi:hypothetical protein
MDIVKSSADLIVPLKEVVRFHWQALKPGTKVRVGLYTWFPQYFLIGW